MMNIYLLYQQFQPFEANSTVTLAPSVLDYTLHSNNHHSPYCASQASGSGGTAGGLALGLHLNGAGVRVHAYGVCDDPDYFYDYIDGLYSGLGATPDVVGDSHPPLSTAHSN